MLACSWCHAQVTASTTELCPACGESLENATVVEDGGAHDGGTADANGGASSAAGDGDTGSESPAEEASAPREAAPSEAEAAPEPDEAAPEADSASATAASEADPPEPPSAESAPPEAAGPDPDAEASATGGTSSDADAESGAPMAPPMPAEVEAAIAAAAQAAAVAVATAAAAEAEAAAAAHAARSESADDAGADAAVPAGESFRLACRKCGAFVDPVAAQECPVCLEPTEGAVRVAWTPPADPDEDHESAPLQVSAREVPEDVREAAGPLAAIEPTLPETPPYGNAVPMSPLREIRSEAPLIERTSSTRLRAVTPPDADFAAPDALRGVPRGRVALLVVAVAIVSFAAGAATGWMLAGH